MTPLMMFFLKFGLLLAGVYVIVLLTPKMAEFIDRHRKPDEPDPPAPRPERVKDELITENNGAAADDKIDNKQNKDTGDN